MPRILNTPLKLLAVFIMTSLSIYWLSTPASADIRCAKVNIELLLGKYHKAAQASRALMTKQKDAKKLYLSLIERRKLLDKTIKELVKKIRDKETPPHAISDLRDKQEALVSEYRSLNKDIQDIETKHMRSTRKQLAAAARASLDEIHATIQDYARENGYQWIIDTSGHSNSKLSPLIYARDAPDITPQILVVINKDAPADNDGEAGSKDAGQTPASSP